MLNIVTTVADALGENLAATYRLYFGALNPEYAVLLGAGARLIIERISASDALYHNAEHTMLVTLVGQDILRGKLLLHPIQPEDWVHFIFALLCHDIGYVRGVCAADDDAGMVIDEDGGRFRLPRGASDAVLTPYHVNRGKIFVRERFGDSSYIDAERLAAAIELTRFPMPNDNDHNATDSEAGLVRAADLIGQVADPRYPQKLTALFHEFLETGAATTLKLESPADLVDIYPGFYWSRIQPYIKDAVKYLQLTSEGRQWIAGLHSHVFTAEHGIMDSGPHLGN
jgi:hypothetical protein